MENLSNMFLIDLQDHRIITLIVCACIIFISITIIIIRFIIHNKKYKKRQDEKDNNL